MVSSNKGKEVITLSNEDEINTRLTKLVAEVEIMKGGQFPMEMDFEDLYMYPRGKLPINVQLPHVEKYNGTTYPQMHLCMYSNAML